METPNYKKLNQHITRLLKVNEIVFPICRTNKGNFGIKFDASGENFDMYLDAVPLPTKNLLDDDNNIELKKILEKYLFDERITSFSRTSNLAPPEKDLKFNTEKTDFLPKKQRGRPKGSKSKNKK